MLARAFAFCLAGLLFAAAPAGAQAPRSRPFGIRCQPDPNGIGWIVRELAPGGRAGRAGVRLGDVIIDGIDARGRKVDVSVRAGFEALRDLVTSERFTIVVLRRDSTEQPVVKIHVGGKMPGGGPVTRPAERPATPPANRPVTRPAARPRTLFLERRTVRDPGIENIASHTLLVPRGWRFRGEVRWTIRRTANPVNFVGAIQAPDGREVVFAPMMAFAYASNPAMLGTQLAPEPGRAMDGSRIAPSPRRPGEVVVRYLLPELRPRARGVRVLSADNPRGAQAPLTELLRPALTDAERLNQWNRKLGNGITTRPWWTAERVRVAYEEDGRRWEEEFHLWVFGIHYALNGGFGMHSEYGNWYVAQIRAMRAPGDLDAGLPTLSLLASSLRETPRWHAVIMRMRRNVAAIQQRGARERSRILSRAAAEISDIQRNAWREQQRGMDRVARAFSDMIRGVQRYRRPDGGTIAIDQNWRRVFSDGNGSYVLSNDALYDPNTDPAFKNHHWSELERYR